MVIEDDNIMIKKGFVLGLFITIVAGVGNANGDNANPDPDPLTTNKKLIDYPNTLKSGDVAKIRGLIKNGVDVNAAANDGATPLGEASQEGHPEIVKLLLAAGADVNAADNDGATPLGLAWQEGHSETVKLLLAAGADVNAVNNKGHQSILTQDDVWYVISAVPIDYDTAVKLYNSGNPLNRESMSSQGTVQDVNAKLLASAAYGNPHASLLLATLIFPAGYPEAAYYHSTIAIELSKRRYWEYFGLNIGWTNEHTNAALALQTAVRPKLTTEKLELLNLQANMFLDLHTAYSLSTEGFAKKAKKSRGTKFDEIVGSLGGGLGVRCSADGVLVDCPRSPLHRKYGYPSVPRERCLQILEEHGYGDPCRLKNKN